MERQALPGGPRLAAARRHEHTQGEGGEGSYFTQHALQSMTSFSNTPTQLSLAKIVEIALMKISTSHSMPQSS